jgi:hypothetical protein
VSLQGQALHVDLAELDRAPLAPAEDRVKGMDRKHRREEELENEWRRLANEADGIQQGKADLADARLCFNAEVELGRRKLRDDRSELSRDQRAWAERRAREQGELRKHFVSLSRRESSLIEVERELLDAHAANPGRATPESRWRWSNFRGLRGISRRTAR